MDNKLGIQDLASAFAERYGMDIKSSTTFVKTVFDIVEEYIAKDKLVKIKGFGTFKLVNVSDRESVNINTGERIVIAGHSKLTFTPDSALKDAVNRPFADFETTVLNEATSIEAMERLPEDSNIGAEEDDIDSGDMPAETLPNTDGDASAEAEEAIEVVQEQVSEPHDVELGFIEEIADSTIDTVNENEHTDNSDDINNSTEQKSLSTASASNEETVVNNDLPDIDTNSTYPMSAETSDNSDCATSKSCRRWPYILLTLSLMALSYVCGCYKVHNMIDIALYSDNMPVQETTTPVPSGEGKNKQIPPTASIVCDTVIRDTLSAAVDTLTTKEATTPEESPEEIAKYFPQVSNGEYWIVGDAGRVHIMQVGETLYRIAKLELGDRELIQYLIVFNNFADPNIIHKGDTIRIPKLIKKQGVVLRNTTTE